MTPEDSRIFLKVMLVLEITSTVKFGPHKCFFHFFLEHQNVQCSSNTHFSSHTFQDLSCTKCSYGPHGPFWFSVKKWPDTVKRYQKNENGEKSNFEMTVKMNLFCGGKFWKATFVCRMLPQGLSFLKNRHFWKFQTCPFWKKCAFPHIYAFFRWRRRRRRRRRADNFSIWPDPHPIAYRDEISRSGIPHFDKEDESTHEGSQGAHLDENKNLCQSAPSSHVRTDEHWLLSALTVRQLRTCNEDATF